MAGRTIAIGDIHGCSLAFATLLGAICPERKDTLIPLGDYIDRGPDSRGVIEQLIELQSHCRLIPILGNHDQALLDVLAGRCPLPLWFDMGGRAALLSYGTENDLSFVPASHVSFLRRCRPYHETRSHLFLHAQYVPELPLRSQSSRWLRWESLRDHVPGPHRSGKTAIVGHTSQKSGEVLDLGHILCIDTYCYGGGWLTALDVDSGRFWQTNQKGELRDV